MCLYLLFIDERYREIRKIILEFKDEYELNDLRKKYKIVMFNLENKTSILKSSIDWGYSDEDEEDFDHDYNAKNKKITIMYHPFAHDKYDFFWCLNEIRN